LQNFAEFLHGLGRIYLFAEVSGNARFCEGVSDLDRLVLARQQFPSGRLAQAREWVSSQQVRLPKLPELGNQPHYFINDM
jgi:hypothetical protein